MLYLHPSTEIIIKQKQLESTLENPTLIPLIENWFQVRNARLMPKRGDMDPVIFFPLLKQVWIMEFMADANTYKYCLTGEDINLSHKTTIKGMTIEESHPTSQIEEVKGYLDQMRREKSIMIMRGQTLHINNLYSLHERIILPLSSDGINVTEVIGATVYHRPSGRASEATGQIISKVETYPVSNFID